MLQPPAPEKPTKVIFPEKQAIKLVPSGAAISIPEWYVDEPVVGAFLWPNFEVIVLLSGIGQIISWLES